MPLILSVVSYKGGVPLQSISASFAETGGVIGRSSDNQLVLPDPDKFVSRKHAIIKYDQGIYSITDTSTGGTSVTNRNILLQHNSIQLADGDRLRIGEYEVQVSLSGDEELSTASVPAFPVIPEPIMSWRNPPVASVDDPFGLDAVFPLANTSKLETPAQPSFIEQPDVAPIHQSLPRLDVVHEEPPEIDVDDLLRALELPPDAGGTNDVPGDVWNFASAMFTEDTPEDALDLDLSPVDPFRPEQVETVDMAVPEVSSPLPIAESPLTSLAGDHNPLSSEALATAVVAEAKIDSFSPPGMPLEESLPPKVILPGADPIVLQPPTVGQVPASVDPSQSVQATESVELFKLFLDGAGIKHAGFLSEEEIPALMRTLGVLFRDLVDGMMTVLRARAELKSQFRVSMTTIRPVNNNPLKFTANVEDAMAILLSGNHPGFVDPVTAVREGLSDLMNHQLAMPAGIQASLGESLKRFDPQRFEQQYQEGIVFQKKAKCWDAYSKAYPSLVNEALENFFGEDFAAAYEQQERILRGHGTNNKP